ncbi:MAG: hypothetical protein VX874_05355 [Pseudomonadota bacterium]|nr:hypothetical protein [Pseudomonadota bacterium]
MKIGFAAALVPAVMTVLGGCTAPGTVAIQLGDTIILEETIGSYESARNSSPFSAPVPITATGGTATYSGGALFDLTQSGGDGDMIFMGLNLTATFGATSAQVEGTMGNAVRASMSSATHDALNDAITATGQTADDAVAAATALIGDFTSTEALSGTVAIASRPVSNADPQWTAPITGTLTGATSEIEVNATAAGILYEPTGEAIRITGTNFGNVELGVNGTPTTAYLNGFAIKQ